MGKVSEAVEKPERRPLCGLSERARFSGIWWWQCRQRGEGERINSLVTDKLVVTGATFQRCFPGFRLDTQVEFLGAITRARKLGEEHDVGDDWTTHLVLGTLRFQHSEEEGGKGNALFE